MNNPNKRVITLWPDEHVDILRQRVWEIHSMLDEAHKKRLIGFLEDICSEMEALSTYLREQRIQESNES